MKELLSNDPFHLTEGLTGRYDETKLIGPSRSLRRSGGGSGPKLPPCGKCTDRQVRKPTPKLRPRWKPEEKQTHIMVKQILQQVAPAAFEEIDNQDQEPELGFCCGGSLEVETGYCQCCHCTVSASEIVDNPRKNDPYINFVCTCCREHILASLHECPNCHSLCGDDKWSKCDRCGVQKCSSGNGALDEGCSDIISVPNAGGWIEESYGRVCGECWCEISEEHDSRRAEEFENIDEEET